MTNELKKVYKRRKVFIFLDNLNIHRNPDFLNTLKQNGHEPIYNASYSSALNPIERLWAFGKKIFGRELVGNCDLKNKAEVEGFVRRSLIQVPADALESHVHSCFKSMV